jgi:PAS domain S-box-containing protein
MENKMKILILEPSLTDSQSIVNEIQKNFDNVNIEIANNRKEFILKLSRFKPHLVILEYNVPNFDGLTSLSITHEMYPELPFIIVTGSPSEDTGILCIKRGAYDYILKQHLSILPVAIEGALKKYELILENKRAYDELRESERKFRLLAENANDLICRLELYPQRKFSYVSPSVKKILGYEPEEFYSRPELLFEIIHNDDKEIIQQLFDGKIDFNRLITYRCFSKSGIMVWLEQTNVPIYDYKNNLIAVQMVARDITSRQMLENELRESENRFRMVSNLITDYAYMFNVDENLNMTGDWVSDSFIRVFGWTIPEIDAMGGWQKCFYEDDLPAVIEHAKKFYLVILIKLNVEWSQNLVIFDGLEIMQFQFLIITQIE